MGLDELLQKQCYYEEVSNPTVFKAGQGGASSSGVRNTIVKQHRRPSRWKRLAQNVKKSIMVYK